MTTHTLVPNEELENLKSQITILEKREVEQDMVIAKLRDDLDSAQNNAMADARARDFADMVPCTVELPTVLLPKDTDKFK